MKSILQNCFRRPSTIGCLHSLMKTQDKCKWRTLKIWRSPVIWKFVLFLNGLDSW
jgi:hypothetical protein